MGYDDWKCSEPVAYEDEAPRVLCAECGVDPSEDEHAVICTQHPDFFEPPGPDTFDDCWDDGGTGGME